MKKLIDIINNKIGEFLQNVSEWIRMKVWLFLSYFFYSIRIDPKWEEKVKQVSLQGKIVHVIRTVHLLDSLCLVYFSKRAGLPQIGYVYGLEQWFFKPLRWIYRFMTYQGKGVDDQKHVNRILNSGGSIIICLRRTPKTLRYRGMEIGQEPLKWLIERVQRTGERIFLIPHAFVWGRRPEKLEPGVIDRFFGPREAPGFLRSIIQVVRSFRSANIIACEPLEIGNFLRQFPSMKESGTIEGAMQRHLAANIDKHRTIVAGPAVRSRYRTADMILSDPQLVEVMKDQAKITGKSEDEIRKKVRKMLDEIMPAYHYAFIDGWETLLNAFGVFNRVFDGIYIEKDEHEMLRLLSKKGPIVLLPGHRSHVDYILLSWVFAHMCDLMVPYIAAGKNLNFWPLGWWFRGSGAFFIRRKIGDDVLYKEVLAAFIRRAVMDGNHIEIFMEGTRSRSGKMLPPRLGLFSMVLDAADRLPPESELTFLPVAINYDRVIEEQSYFLEQSGMDKRAENIRALYETQDVLQSRFGRIYVRFGKPFSLSEIRREYGKLKDRYLIEKFAYQIFYEIDRSFHITPTGLAATTLLCCPHSGLSEEDFFKDVIFYFRFAVATGKKVSRVLLPCKEIKDEEIGNESSVAWREIREIMYHALHLLAGDDLIRMSAGGRGVYYVPEKSRLRLDYYKNAFIGTMGPHALACCSLLSSGGNEVSISDLRESARFLSKLMKNEFIFNPYLNFEANFAATLLFMEAMEMIEVEGGAEGKGMVTIRNRKNVEKIGGLIQSLLETYYVTTLSVISFGGKAVSEREVIRRAFRIHERLVLERQTKFVEARNRQAAGFCIRALRDAGVLKEVGNKNFVLGSVPDSREAIEQIIIKLKKLIYK